jgi:hypothetical protein
MELVLDSSSDGFSLQPSFSPDDFPDLRLYDRAYETQRAALSGGMHHCPLTPALRRGALRLFHNKRIDHKELQDHSIAGAKKPWLDAPVLLSCEDTTHLRLDNAEAGPLRDGTDRGFLAHYSAAVLPETGMPCGWLGALVWSRKDFPLRAQDHKTRPLDERESYKWFLLRSEVLAAARKAGFRGRIISINDREGDAWGALSTSLARKDELIVRANQNRCVVGRRQKLFAVVHRQRSAACLTLEIATATKTGAIKRRAAKLSLRWCRVTLAPPKSDPFAPREPLTLVVIELYERRPPKGAKRFVSRLLTNCTVESTAAALEVVGWYGDRWGVEVSNDILKNALELEQLPLRDKAAVKRAVAVMGPAVMQVAEWVSLSRRPSPPKVEAVFAKETLAELREYAEYSQMTAPGQWTLKAVVEVLGRLGGGDVRPTRPPGWRVVLRGWQRFEEFRKLKNFLSNREKR